MRVARIAPMSRCCAFVSGAGNKKMYRAPRGAGITAATTSHSLLIWHKRARFVY